MHVKFDEFDDQQSIIEIDDEEDEIVRSQHLDSNQEPTPQVLPKT
jgi:hypothetical protein